MSHTPGPWVIFVDRDEAEYVVLPAMRAGQIATVWAKDAGDAIASANASLIAAAPDLLEALKRTKTVAMPPEITDLVYAAVAKAEGRS
jgi:hypothetical protein